MHNWLFVVHNLIQRIAQSPLGSYQDINTTGTNTTVLLINKVKGCCGKVIVC